MQRIIQQIDGWAEMTPSQLHAALAEIVETPIKTPVTFGDIHTVLGDEQLSRLVISTVKSAAATDPLLDSSYIALSGVGLQLYSADRQEMVDQLAVTGSWPDEVRDAIKALGVHRETRWANLGGDGEVPSEAEIASAKSAMQAAAYGETLVQRVGAAIRLAAAAEGATEQTIRDAAIAEVQS